MRSDIVSVRVARLFANSEHIGYRFIFQRVNPAGVECYDVDKATVPIDMAVYLTVESQQDIYMIAVGDKYLSEDEIHNRSKVADISGSRRNLNKVVSLYKYHKQGVNSRGVRATTPAMRGLPSV